MDNTILTTNNSVKSFAIGGRVCKNIILYCVRNSVMTYIRGKHRLIE